MNYSYKYPRPAVTVDIIIIRDACANPEILLIQRLLPPYKDQWAIPGGFINMDETAEQAAERELSEETGLENIILNQFRAYSAVDRDPRGRTITIVFTGVAKIDAEPKSGSDAKNAKWFKINSLPKLAFDHELILTDFKNSI